MSRGPSVATRGPSEQKGEALVDQVEQEDVVIRRQKLASQLLAHIGLDYPALNAEAIEASELRASKGSANALASDDRAR